MGVGEQAPLCPPVITTSPASLPLIGPPGIGAPASRLLYPLPTRAGANIGLFCLRLLLDARLAPRVARVHALEPLPPIADVLEANLAAHGVADKVGGVRDTPGRGAASDACPEGAMGEPALSGGKCRGPSGPTLCILPPATPCRSRCTAARCTAPPACCPSPSTPACPATRRLARGRSGGGSARAWRRAWAAAPPTPASREPAGEQGRGRRGGAVHSDQHSTVGPLLRYMRATHPSPNPPPQGGLPRHHAGPAGPGAAPGADRPAQGAWVIRALGGPAGYAAFATRC